MSIRVSQPKLSRKWQAEKQAKKKWVEIWEKIRNRILKLPEWMQKILIDDINTAIENRVAIMEMIQNAKRSS